MQKKFIKMNNNKKYLSLGNLVNIIKKYSKVKESSIQGEVFCAIFNINNINNTTVNNYLIGYRPIGLEYKKIYLELKNTYTEDKTIFYPIYANIIRILEENIITKDNITIDLINKNINIKNVCKDLLKLSNEDINVNETEKNYMYELYKTNNIYECFIEILFYTILENKQPIFDENINIDLNNNELKEYLKINLFEGISYIHSLIAISKKDNMYANAELGSLEYSGLITGNVDYEKCFSYYKKAALKNHPKACWMVANLILSKKVKENNLEIMLKYLEKAINLGSIAALNTMGKCYLTGQAKDGINIEKAISYFEKASNLGYSYAYNNLGLYYEKINEYKKAKEYYKLSADLNNSWALNKVGEILRKEGNLKDAFFYYTKSIECPISERNYYAYYNLANYYYLDGFKELNINKNIKKYNEYISIFEKNYKKNNII